MFPEIQEKREEKKRLDAEAAQKKRMELLRKQQEEREKEAARQQADIEARRKEIEEKHKKEAEERAKQKEVDNQRCRNEISMVIDQQEKPARDSLGRRWVRCEECGKVELEDEFPIYGGKNHVNLGTCYSCMRKKQ